MRPWVVTFGVLLILVGLTAGVAGATARGFAEACGGDARCEQSDEIVVARAFGSGLLTAGFVLGVTGIALLVTGIATEKKPKPRKIPVLTTEEKACPRCTKVNGLKSRFCIECGLAFQRPCPQCDAELTRDARFCTGCGAAVAPMAVR